MAAPLVLTGFVSPSEPRPEAVNTTAASAGAEQQGLDLTDMRRPVPWLPPPPAGGSPPQSAAFSVPAGCWSPIERVRSSLPDVQERVSPPDAADQAGGSPGPASGAAVAGTSRAALAHSASEVSIELYGSAPSALENGGSGSHDWGGRATEAGGGSFSAASPGRAAALAAAISAAVGNDEHDDLSDDDAAAPLQPGIGGANDYAQMEGAMSDDSLAFEHDEHHRRDQPHAIRASPLSAQQLGGGEPAAAGFRAMGHHSAAPGVQPRIAPAESDGQHPYPAARSSCAVEQSPTSSPAGRAAAVSAAQPRAGLLWLPSPVFSSAGESATPGAAAAASPDKVCASLAAACPARRGGGRAGRALNSAIPHA